MSRTRRVQVVLALTVTALVVYACTVYAGCGGSGCGATRGATGASAAPRLGCGAAAKKCGAVAKKCGAGCAKACCAAKKAKKCGAGCTKPCCAAKKQSVEPAVSTDTLKVLLRANTGLVLLDARGGTKWDDGKRIPGAKPLAVNASPEAIAQAVGSKDALVVTYCGSLKCPLSRRLGQRLRTLGYRNVLEYPNGIKGWLGATNPAPAKAPLASPTTQTSLAPSCGSRGCGN